MFIFMGLALLALVLLASGVGEGLLFGLLILGLFAAFGPQRRNRDHHARRMRYGYGWDQFGWQPQQPTGWAPQPSSWVPQRASRLPRDVQLKAEQISRKAESLMSEAHRFPTGSQDLYVLERTRSEYLPNTLDAYLALPPGYENAPVSADGKTALQALWEQLNLLDSKLDEIGYNLHRQNLDRLVANGRFLEERFGSRQSELDSALSR
jgi:hypothetical protein